MHWITTSSRRLAGCALLVAVVSQFLLLAHELEARHTSEDETECEVCLVLDRTTNALIALSPGLSAAYLQADALPATLAPLGDARPTTEFARGPPTC